MTMHGHYKPNTAKFRALSRIFISDHVFEIGDVFEVDGTGNLHFNGEQRELKEPLDMAVRAGYLEALPATPGTQPVQKPPPEVVLEGPYAEIRLIKKTEKDTYEAFDEHGNLLLHLNEEGANAVADADSFRIVLEED